MTAFRFEGGEILAVSPKLNRWEEVRVITPTEGGYVMRRASGQQVRLLGEDIVDMHAGGRLKIVRGASTSARSVEEGLADAVAEAGRLAQRLLDCIASRARRSRHGSGEPRAVRRSRPVLESSAELSCGERYRDLPVRRAYHYYLHHAADVGERTVSLSTFRRAVIASRARRDEVVRNMGRSERSRRDSGSSRL